MEWSEDENFVFYLRNDDSLRPYQLWRHKIGSDPDDDVLLYEENDEKFHLSLDKTNDESLLLLESESIKTKEILLLSSKNPTNPFQIFKKRNQDEEYSIEIQNNHLFLLTNANDKKNFELYCTNLPDFSKVLNDDKGAFFDIDDYKELNQWKLLIPHNPKVFLEEIKTFQNYLVISQRFNGLARILIIPSSSDNEIDMKLSYFIDFPEPSYSVEIRGNWEYDTDSLRYQYSSLVTPKSTFSYNMTSHEATLLKQQEILGNFDPSKYQVEM